MITKNQKHAVEGITDKGVPYRAVNYPGTGLTVYRADSRGPGFSDINDLRLVEAEVSSVRPDIVDPKLAD